MRNACGILGVDEKNRIKFSVKIWVWVCRLDSTCPGQIPVVDFCKHRSEPWVS